MHISNEKQDINFTLCRKRNLRLNCELISYNGNKHLNSSGRQFAKNIETERNRTERNP